MHCSTDLTTYIRQVSPRTPRGHFQRLVKIVEDIVNDLDIKIDSWTGAAADFGFDPIGLGTNPEFLKWAAESERESDLLMPFVGCTVCI